MILVSLVFFPYYFCKRAVLDLAFQPFDVFKISIFNRWGNEVWEGKDYDNDKVMWRGQNQHGEKLPDGTYYYVIELGDKTLSGFVELVH